MLARALLSLTLGLSAVAHAQAPASISLRPAVPVRFEATQSGGALLIGRGASATRIVLPLSAPEITTRVVRLSGHSVGVVELREAHKHFAIVVDVRGARANVRWTGRLDLHGDPGERRRDVLRVEDLTGDGVDDLLVGTIEEARTLCGVETILQPQALDPRSGELRSVSIRRLPVVENELAIPASTERPRELRDDVPLVRALVPRAATSTSGVPDFAVSPPAPLTDGDRSTAWIEGHPGNGRWEGVSFAWAASGLHARFVALVPSDHADAPAAVWLLHDEGRVRVRAPESDGVWWIRLPEPVQTRCISLVLDAPPGDPATAHTGFAEVRVFTEVESGDGLDGLFVRLAEGGREADAAARALALVGEPALEHLATRWADMPTRERLALMPLLERHAGRDDAGALLRSAAQATEPTLSEAALAACERSDAGRQLLASLIENSRVGDQAATAVSRVAPALALPALLAALSAPEGSERPALRDALRTAASRTAALEPLRRWLLAEPPTSAVAAAVLSLAAAEDTQALVPLLWPTATHAERFEDRWRLLKAANFLPRETTEAFLDEHLRAEEWMLRREALRAIARWDADEISRARVRPLLEDPYPRVRASAVETMERLAPTPRDVETLAALARRDKWPLVREAGIRALVAFPRALPILRVGVDDPSRRVRAAAIHGLRTQADERAWPRIEARMNDDGEWPEVISAGVHYARTLCLASSVPTLRTLVDRGHRAGAWAPDVDLAVAAIDALLAIGGAEADGVIRTAQAENSPPLIRAAARATERVTRCGN